MNTIFEESIEFWDKKYPYRNVIRATFKHISIEQQMSTDVSYMICEDKNSGKKLKTSVQIVASVYKSEDKFVWVWNWSNPRNNNYTIKLSLDIFKYGQKLKEDEYPTLKNLLINSRFIFDSSKHLISVYAALVSFILKNPYVEIIEFDENKSDVFNVICLEEIDKIDKYVEDIKKS